MQLQALRPRAPGTLTQERLVLRAQREAAAIFNQIIAEVASFRDQHITVIGWRKVSALLDQLRSLEADTNTAGLILGMLSPWLPNLRDTPSGAPRDVKSLSLAVKGLDDILPEGQGYRWPTLEDSIKWLTDNRLASKESLQDLHARLKRRAFTDSQIEDRKTLAKLQQALADSIRDGDSLTSFRERLKGSVALPKSQAETIFRTNTKQAFLAGQENTLNQPGVRDRFRWVLYVATRDTRVRPWHWFFDGWVAERGTALHHLFLQVQGEHNCFLPGSKVSGNFTTAMRSRYSGKAVEIITQAGSVIRVTQNHPVLTEHGWVRAGAIQEGNQLLRHVVEREVVGIDSPPLALNERPSHIHNEPAAVEEVFHAFATSGRVEHHASVVRDFHGDGEFVEGDVEVVCANRELLGAGKPVGTDHVRNLILESPLSGLMSLEDLAGTLVVGHSGPFQSLRVGSTAGLDALLNKSSIHGTAVNAQALGDRIDRLSGCKSGGDLRVREQSTGPGFHPESSHPAADGLRLASKLLANLKDGQAGLVSRDKVTAKREIQYTGHVYDFSSVTGVIVTEGNLLSNCRCGMIPVDQKRAEKYGVKTIKDVPQTILNQIRLESSLS